MRCSSRVHHDGGAAAAQLTPQSSASLAAALDDEPSVGRDATAACSGRSATMGRAAAPRPAARCPLVPLPLPAVAPRAAWPGRRRPPGPRTCASASSCVARAADRGDVRDLTMVARPVTGSTTLVYVMQPPPGPSPSPPLLVPQLTPPHLASGSVSRPAMPSLSVVVGRWRASPARRGRSSGLTAPAPAVPSVSGSVTSANVTVFPRFPSPGTTRFAAWSLATAPPSRGAFVPVVRVADDATRGARSPRAATGATASMVLLVGARGAVRGSTFSGSLHVPVRRLRSIGTAVAASAR